MGNGEWGMENGEWEMGNGEWEIENRKWEIENGKWKIENGKLNFFPLPFYNVEYIFSAAIIRYPRLTFCNVLRHNKRI